MVHGFGAFLQHYRDNIKEIADNGFRVWAITLLGFGKSEKPNAGYSELMWAELLRDFIVDVINEPVHVVGNSLGGKCLFLSCQLKMYINSFLIKSHLSGQVIFLP